jgi:hypothetical protein
MTDRIKTLDDLHARRSHADRMTRRGILGAGVGLGWLALSDMRGGGALAQAMNRGLAGAGSGEKGVLTTGQIPARAKRVVSIHMCGAVSQVDTFDYKPTLIQRHGEEIPPSVKQAGGRISAMSNGQTSFPLVQPIAPFRQYGQTGKWVSDLMPFTGAIADELTFVHSLTTEHVNHNPASMFLHTGFQLSGRPSAGAWVNYALGTDNANMPSFIVMKSRHQSSGVSADGGYWGAGFLPSHYQGVELRAGEDPVLYVHTPPGLERADRRAQLDIIDDLAAAQYEASGDPEILSKVAQYEMAYRMQESMPEAADLSDEPDYIFDLYGPESRKPGTFARNCLLTRRLLERGVKFVQLVQLGWDHHNSITRRHPPDCMAVDQPSAALVADLKQRGLLDDTLVVWGSEFGRTSYAQGRISDVDMMGRDHHGSAFTFWMAGAGLKPGYSHGESDEFSYNIVDRPQTIHDLHATMMHLLGVDHKQLTYHFQGRDFRLTDVHGEVMHDIIA